MKRMFMTALLLGAVATSAACTSEDPGKSVASVGGSSSTTQAAAASADPVAYAQCMRANGIANFPDPKADGGMAFDENSGIDPESQQFKDADAKCKQFMPADAGKRTTGDQWPAEDKLKYAQCMRENGVPAFPDPDADGGFPALIQGGPVDPESPQFQAAEKACQQYVPQNMPQKNRTGS
ncbi:hypothetical protein ABZ215_13250 [Amycolatopsis sp. NPDC006131]|uniref:hypothetical protein n=1 Tax=Amycolatopsis sp. NPDC006131 TaxID=3156731 RepID=UPI0033B4A731